MMNSTTALPAISTKARIVSQWEKGRLTSKACGGPCCLLNWCICGKEWGQTQENLPDSPKRQYGRLFCAWCWPDWLFKTWKRKWLRDNILLSGYCLFLCDCCMGDWAVLWVCCCRPLTCESGVRSQVFWDRERQAGCLNQFQGGYSIQRIICSCWHLVCIPAKFKAFTIPMVDLTCGHCGRSEKQRLSPGQAIRRISNTESCKKRENCSFSRLSSNLAPQTIHHVYSVAFFVGTVQTGIILWQETFPSVKASAAY